MTSADYRMESSHPIANPWLPASEAQQHLFSDRALAVTVAAKSHTRPDGKEIRVVHVPTGEVVFRKTATTTRSEWSDEV